MKQLLLALLALLVAIQTNGQDVESYNLNVGINVAQKKLHVEGYLKIDFGGRDSICLTLWKNTTISTIRSKKARIGYRFDTAAPSPILYIPHGGRLTLTKPATGKSEQQVFVCYDCDMKSMNGWGSTFSEEWVELNFYCAWFPLKGFCKSFTTTIVVDDGYNVSGSGVVSKKGRKWTMKQPWPSFDNVIVASKELKAKSIDDNGRHIEVDYCNVSDSGIDSTMVECRYMFNLFSQLFGAKDSAYFKLVLAPYGQGGGYSRKNFVAWRSNRLDFNTRTGLSHEIGHFWWNSANTTTWEDWLNESFANYCMLIYIKERVGLRVFNLNIDFFRKQSQNTPPIWGLSRDNPQAQVVLYQKGALILYELSQKVGEEKFFGLLRVASAGKIRTTDEFLLLVEKTLSRDVRDWLVDKLKAA